MSCLICSQKFIKKKGNPFLYDLALSRVPNRKTKACISNAVV